MFTLDTVNIFSSLNTEFISVGKKFQNYRFVPMNSSSKKQWQVWVWFFPSSQ